MSIKLTTPEAALSLLESTLQRLPNLPLAGVVRKPAQVLEKSWSAKLPQPGYPGDKDTSNPLAGSLTTKSKDVNGVRYIAIVGGQRDKGGRHEHLVEEGHELFSHGKNTGKKTRPGKYGEQAAAETEAERERVFLDALTAAVDKALGI